MNKFDHPNVLSLSGVCLDGGPAPFIIMPLMANGSLLSYLKKNRSSLVLSSQIDVDMEEVEFHMSLSTRTIIFTCLFSECDIIIMLLLYM